MSKSNKDVSLPKPYEGLVDEELTPEQVAQRDYNLVRFVEFLIKLDKQKQQKVNN